MEGVSIFALIALIQAIREKAHLVVQVKVLDGPWANLSMAKVQEMVLAVRTGAVADSRDIRLRLFARSNPEHSTE